MNKKGSPTFQKASDKKIHPYMTPPTLADKKGVSSMGVPTPEETDLSKREESCNTCEKVRKESINTNNMSKFLFDRLFEDVMSGSELGGGDDTADLGIDVGGDSGSDLGGGDEVTITLDRATAEKLIDLIQGAMGGVGEDEGELDGEGGGEEGGEEDFGGEDEDEGAMGESIEVVAEPKPFDAKPETLQKRDNKVSSKYKAAGGKAHTGNIAALQAEPKPLGAKADTLQSKSNKVAGFSTAGTIFGS